MDNRIIQFELLNKELNDRLERVTKDNSLFEILLNERN